jgi:hypothetical protein
MKQIHRLCENTYLIFDEGFEDKKYERVVASGWVHNSMYHIEPNEPDPELHHFTEDTKLLHFGQKWDGCQNINFKGCWHGCDDSHCDQLALILKKIRELGLQRIKDCGGNIL